jgi:flagellar motor switch protein FliM
MFMGEKFGRDSIWETHLGNELLMTDMKMRAVLDEVTLPLAEIMSWKPGSRLMLNVKPDDLIALRAGDVTLFHGRMGSLNDRIAVRVEEVTLGEKKDDDL